MRTAGGKALRGAASRLALATAVMAVPGGWAHAQVAGLLQAASQAAAQATDAVTPQPTAAAAPPQTRPNINPYDRDIAMTVPLNFNRRVLGEMPVVLTRDDRFIVDSAGFRALIDPLLTPEAQEELRLRLEGVDSFAPEEINETGIKLDYDPDQLAVLVLRIDPTKRSVESLFQGGRPEEPGEAPEDFSAYLNSNLAVSRRQSTGDVTSPSVFLNGAVRYKSLVFEADVQGREDQFSGDYEVERRYARFVFDQPADYRRWYLGDLNVETRGRQGFVEMGGVGVTRQRQRFDSFRNNVLAGGRQLVLQEASTVRVLRNGVFVREFQLDPGQYDVSNLPLDTGSNDIQLEIQNESGRRETIAYSAYLDSIDLEPGDYEYGAYLGVTNVGSFGSPDYSDGDLAFSGFWRKAFMNRPAVGLGFQASETVQNVAGQTQFILRNGARLQLDVSASHADVGAGYAYAVSFDHFVDMGGTYDSWTVVADYTSEDYATLGSESGANPASWVFTGGYSHQFSENWTATMSASYRMGRGASGDSYALSAVSAYRFTPQWSVQVGAEWVDYGSNIGGANGAGVTVALVWQPRYDRRAEARYSSARNSGSLRFQQSTENRVGSFGYSIASTYDDGPGTLSGQVDYIANRFDASLTHTGFGQSFSNITDEQVTSLRVGTSISTAGGKVAVGRNVYDSFAILHPHESLRDKPVIVGESFERGAYTSRSGALGPAVANTLSAYVDQSVRYDVMGVPPGYDIGEGVRRVRPTYRSGYAIQVGSDAFVSALGRLIGNAGKPAALISGRVRPVDDPTAEPELFFTNSVGRFAIQKLVPGKTYRVELFSSPAAGFEFTVPANNEGLLDLKTVAVPVDITDQ